MPQLTDLDMQWFLRFPRLRSLGSWGALLSLMVGLSGCGVFSKADAEAPRRPSGGQGGPTPVDVAIAETGNLRSELEVAGKTQPAREVSLRSQVEGQLLEVLVDVGDTVRQGQTLAQVDASLLATAVAGEQAELAALESEVAQANAEVNDARTQVEEARLQLQQAQADAQRLQQLLSEGAIAAQAAEQAQTEARTAAQALRSAQEQVRTRQQAVVSAQKRVAAQQAVVAQAQERQSYGALKSPVSGVVLQRDIDPGTLVQPGAEVLRLGDFSNVKVIVEVADQQLANLRLGQRARVRLDAFPEETFEGTITRITPVATNQLYVPVEVTIANDAGQIGSGLLARVSFAQTRSPRVVVPQSALQAAKTRGDRPAGQPAKNGTVFVLAEAGQQPQVIARSVTLGEQADGKVEVLSGLRPGERFVARSGRPLKEGDPVRLSILSEPRDSQPAPPQRR